jgi:predicted amidohydrolase YtcJ
VVKNIPVYRLEHAVGVGLRSGFGDDWLRVGGVKIFADGALGPRTAAMLEPYEGEPENRGIVVTDKEEMMEVARQASAAGLSVTVHAIGDRANHDVLDVYEALRSEEGGIGRGPADRPIGQRHRIEHVQLFHPMDQARLARLGVIASMQPNHATSDMEMADRYWGQRAQYSYAWRKLLDAGTLLVFGSDAPIEPLEPLGNLYAAVSRRRPNGLPGPDGWYPDQRLTMAEAVYGFTMAAAITSGRESTMGTIAPGKLADVTIFDRDIFRVAPAELLEASVVGTIVGGQFAHRLF